MGDAPLGHDRGRLGGDDAGADTANALRCWLCQGCGTPSMAEYWHIGAPAM